MYSLNPDDEDYSPVVPRTTKWRRLKVANDIDNDSTVGNVLSESDNEDNESGHVLLDLEEVLLEDEDLMCGLPNNTGTVESK